jgi:hypothetical protein
MKLSETSTTKDSVLHTEVISESDLISNSCCMNALLNGNDKFDLYAIKYRLFRCANYPTTSGHREVLLEERMGFEGRKWIVIMDGFTIGKDFKFHYESMPSSRTEKKKYLNNTRFDDKLDAIIALKKHIELLDGEQGVLFID